MPILGAMGAAAASGFGFSRIVSATGDLYSFSNFTFTTAGITGRLGPTISNCLASYNTTLYPWLNNTSYFNVITQGYQRWTVPSTGNYTIQCRGAQGGSVDSVTGGLGANLTGTFSLVKGDILEIIVGQSGSRTGVQPSGSGGGGSFVVRSGTLLIAAGGGGGAAVAGTGAPGILTGQNASTGTSGTAGQDGLNAGGTNGAGGSSSGTWSGAAGAGFSSNGGSAFQSGASISNSQGFSYASGFLGGVAAPSYGSPGGFGGGGGSSWGPSGGGGYSGGGSDNTAGSGNDRQGGGGGGSFNSGTSQSTSSGISGAGSVTITFAPPSPAFASGVQKAPSGTYTLRSANGWTNASAGMFTVNSYDDGLTSNFSGIIPAGTSWFWNNVAYTSQIIYANSYISWSGAQDLLFYAGDQYWGTNGPNGTGSSNAGLGYKSGVTAGGWNYFYMNLQGYQYGATGSDRTWEAHFVYNSDNSIQYIEIIVPATVNSPGSFTEGPTSPTNNRQNLFTLAGSTVPASGVWSSTNKGVTWTFLGSGSLTNIPS